VATNKRQRKKQARDARRQAELAAARRGTLRRRIIGAVVVAAIFVALLTVLTSGDDDEEVASEDTSTTTETTTPAEFVFGTTECPPADNTERKTEFADSPQKCLEDGVDYQAAMKTSKGTFTVDLLEENAPGTVNNFVFLARWNYYDGVGFHRVIPGFVVQGGDAVGDPPGTGGPGYQIADELPEQGDYELGSVAMANSGPDTNGSQFFVIVGDQGVQLPPNFSLFGTVVEGLDIAHEIEAGGTAEGEPKELVTIEDVEIVEKAA